MEHLAVMNPKWKLIEKILSGEKSIESRWYAHKIAPWNRISIGDTVYFKDSGKLVTAKASVEKVLQKELSSIGEGVQLIHQFKSQLCFTDESLKDFSWLQRKKYVVLVFLSNPEKVVPFAINKSGYGSACAWISVDSIIKLKSSIHRL